MSAAPMRAGICPPDRDRQPGRQELGYPDTGAMWRSRYDMPPDEFAAMTDRLWNEVKPLYDELHCYTRAELNDKYGDAVQPATGPIRADLLGNHVGAGMGQYLRRRRAAKGAGDVGYDLTELLVREQIHAREDRPHRRGLLHLAGLRAAAGRPSGSAR